MFESRPHFIILQTAKVVPTSDMSINTKTRHLAMIGLTDKDWTIKESLIMALHAINGLSSSQRKTTVCKHLGPRERQLGSYLYIRLYYKSLIQANLRSVWPNPNRHGISNHPAVGEWDPQHGRHTGQLRHGEHEHWQVNILNVNKGV